MKNKHVKLEPDETKPPVSAVGVILTIVCILSGSYACTRLAQIFPIWLAVLVTIAIGILLVASLTASLGNELLDIAIGCAVIIIFMTMVGPVCAKKFQRSQAATAKSKQVIQRVP